MIPVKRLVMGLWGTGLAGKSKKPEQQIMHTINQGCRVGAVRNRIPNNTGSRSMIFLSDSGCPFGHHTPKLGIPVEMVQFLLKLLLNQRFLAVYHHFH